MKSEVAASLPAQGRGQTSHYHGQAERALPPSSVRTASVWHLGRSSHQHFGSEEQKVVRRKQAGKAINQKSKLNGSDQEEARVVAFSTIEREWASHDQLLSLQTIIQYFYQQVKTF